MAAASSSSMTTATLTGTPHQNLCFNFNCKVALETSRKGWRRRTGDFAHLCDRCSFAYEEGKFCETFHLNSSGWRCCESCGKQIHCGCIVSFHMFVLLDAGGIECITCARKSFILTPNPAWPPPSLLLPLQHERNKDVSLRNWSPIAGSGPVPWRQAPSLFNATSIQTDLQSRVPTEVDGLHFNERLSSSFMEKRKMEDSFDRLINSSMNIDCLDVKRGTRVSSGEEQPSSSLNQPQQIGHSSTPGFSLVVGSVSKTRTDDHMMVTGTMHQPTHSQVEKQSCNLNQVDITEAQPLKFKEVLKAKSATKVRSQLLPRYWPQISEEELQRISEDSNSVITPLFEKMLSASDAGKIGRLVLPKKCAEAYLPPISQPEGLPLKVQDSKGKEWVFQFRFWPNNNSRMYVLEGITPCIQSMQLQAGDIVTFSRIEPEGKLVMGCRKVSAATSEKGNGASKTAPKYSSNGEVVGKGKKAGESAEYIELAQTNLPTTVNAASPSFMPLNQQIAEPASAWCDADKQSHVGVKANSSARGLKKNGTVGLKRKRLKIDSEDVVELKVSWEQVQGLLRPPSNKDPTVFVIDGCEFEEFEDAPVIGRPTIPASDCHGKRVQWVQCEKCFKWREVPADALLKSSWTCSENLWDTARSLCSADEELTSEKLEALLPIMSCAASEKMKDPESIEALEGLDALANMAIQEKPTSSQARTKHPRHKHGCSCIVCLQPPSGKGPKHKKPCDCVVCKSRKRRNETLMLKREQKQSEKEPQTGRQTSQHEHSCEDHCKIGRNRSSKEEEEEEGEEEEEEEDEGSSDECPDNADEQSPASPSKGSHIDLNIQPDREEQLSGTLPDTTEENQRHQRLSEYIRSSMGSSEARLDTKVRDQRLQRLSEYVKSSVTNHAQQDVIRHTNTNSSMQLENKQIVLPQSSSPKGIIASTTAADSRTSLMIQIMDQLNHK